VFVVNTLSRTVSILPANLSSLKADTMEIDKGSVDIKVGPDNRTIFVVSEQSHSLLVAEVP
jgi:hypothetical protein